MALRGRALTVLLAASWISGAAADNASSQGLNASGNSSLEGVSSVEAEASGSTSAAPEASEPERPANASAEELSGRAASEVEVSRRAAASAVAEVAELSQRVELARPAATTDAVESLKEVAVQELGTNTSSRSKDLNAGKESSGHETIVASVSADGTVSEEPVINDGLEQVVEDDYEPMAGSDEDELEDSPSISKPVLAEAPSGRKRSSMVRSERLGAGDVALDLPLGVLAAAVVNATASTDVPPNSRMSLWKDFRTLFVLLIVLCLPMVLLLVAANLCMGLDIPKPRSSSVSKFPHPAGLDAVRRRPLVK